MSRAVARRQEERRPVTVVFVDVVGSTSVAEMLDPEDVLARLDPYYALATDTIERHGGVVEKFIGDAVVGLFGATTAAENDGERAVTAALRIVDEVSELEDVEGVPALQVRVGVATGEAIVSIHARPADGRGVAWGDVLNTAARLQSAAPIDRVLVDDPTYRLCRHRIEFGATEAVNAKGKAEPVGAWLAVASAVSTGALRDPGAPFVGRADELGRLLATFANVRDSALSARTAVIGEPGVGKSWLVSEATAGMVGARILWGRCLDYGAGMTYWPVAEMLRAAAGIRIADPPAEAARLLRELMERLPTHDADVLHTISAALTTVAGGPSSEHGAYEAPSVGEEELRWGLLRTFELLGRLEPLVLVFEDLHWAEPALLDLVRALRTLDAPVLTIATTRSEHVAEEGWEPEEQLSLDPLDGAASTSLLTTLLEQGDVAVEPHLVDELLARGRGNPLYLSEMIRVLVAATGRGGVPDLDLLPVAEGVKALVGARLDGLGAPARRVAQTVSVMGEVFWSGAAAHLVGGAADLDAALDELEEASILHRRPGSSVAGEAEWAFSHVVLRDVAYQRLPKSGRVELHTRFADWLSAIESGADLVEVVAFHLERSCLLARELSLRAATPPTERAVEALSAAADRAERRRGLRDSLSFTRRALALASADDARLGASLRLRRARNLVWLGELDDADAQLRAVALEAVVGGWVELDCEAEALLANVAMKQERFVDAGGYIERARIAAEGLGEHPLRVRVSFEAAALDDYEGRFDEAVETLESAIAVAAALDDPDMVSEGHLRLGTVLFNCGRLAEADVALSRCTATPGGSVHRAAQASFAQAEVLHHLGRFEESERLARRAEAWLQRTQTNTMRVQNLFLLALHARRRGDAEHAEEALRTALELSGRGGVAWLQEEARRLLVEQLVLDRRIDEARELLGAEPDPARQPRGYAAVARDLAGGALLLGERRREAATNLYERAFRELERLRLQGDLSAARLGYARVLRAVEDLAAARIQVSLARDALGGMDAPGLAVEIDDEAARLT